MRALLKSLKTWLSRRKWFYSSVFRWRAWSYAVCEWLSRLVSRLRGRPVLIGIDLLPPPVRQSSFKYEIAVALRFKNEALYLAEWIEFHEAIGVDHFYLYDNNSTDDFREVLAPYVERDLITLHHWSNVPASPGADLHCIENYRDEAGWIAFIDADEFLVSSSERSLKSILSDYEDHPALAVNWIYFGSNGHLTRPSGGVLRNFTRRSAAPNRHVKSIVNPRRVIKYGNSHHWYYSRGALAVNTSGAPVLGSFSEPPVADILRINHYYCKSREEFMAKVAMKSWVDKEGARFPSRTADAWNAQASANNDVEDRAACQFCDAFDLTFENRS